MQELEDLKVKEQERQGDFKYIFEESEMSFYLNQLNISNEFFVEIVNFFEFLVTFYDNWPVFEDYIKLPGGKFLKIDD